MFTKNMKAGYQGRKDEMRDKAQRLMKDDSHSQVRAYKDGGHVKEREETMERIENFKDETERHKQHMHHKNMQHLAKGEDVEMKKDKKKTDSSAKKKDCNVQKFAMGGVAKIRHDEATKSGMPIKPKKGSVKGIL